MRTMGWAARRPWWVGLCLAVAVVVLGARPAAAQDALFQNFFIDACGGTVAGGLATACGVDANLAGDSETSLNPAQVGAGADLSRARAESLIGEAQERMEKARDEEAGMQPASGPGDEVVFGGLSLFLNGKVEVFDRDRNEVDEERSYDGTTLGVQIGADYRVTDSWVVGALFGFDQTNTNFDRDGPSRNFVPFPNEGGVLADNFFLNLYSSYTIVGGLYVDGTVGAGVTDYNFDRDVLYLDSGRTTPIPVIAEGETWGMQYSASGGVGYDFYYDSLSFGPYGRVSYVRTFVDGFTEDDINGSGLQMTFADDETDSFTTVLGFGASYAISTEFGVIIPQARVEWEHEFADDARTIEARFVNDASNTVFLTRTDSPDRTYYNLAGSVMLILPNGWIAFADAESLVNYKDFERHTFTLGVRAEF